MNEKLYRENKMNQKILAKALEYCFNQLTKEEFYYCIQECPWTALVYYSDKLTDEQFDYCVRRERSAALQYCAGNLPYYQTSEKDNGFDWDRCRVYCSVGKSYSHQRFMTYVAEWFGTTVKEMKLQWSNVK